MIPWDAVEAIGTWVGSIGTAGALFLGFWILRGDRKRAERAQAMRVVVSLTTFSTTLHREFWSALVRVNNHSDLPVFNVELESNVEEVTPITIVSDHSELSGVRVNPGKELVFKTNPPLQVDVAGGDWIISFEDAAGKSWDYYTTSRELKPFNPNVAKRCSKARLRADDTHHRAMLMEDSNTHSPDEPNEIS